MSRQSKTERIEIRATVEQKQALERAAAAEGSPVAVFVLRAALKAATPAPAPLPVPPMLTPEHEARLAAEHGADAVARYHDERAIRLRAATKDGA